MTSCPYLRYLNPETREYTAEFVAFEDAITRHCPNFDCNQIASALDRGLTVEEAVAEIQAADHEQRDYARVLDREAGLHLDHDYSMNG